MNKHEVGEENGDGEDVVDDDGEEKDEEDEE